MLKNIIIFSILFFPLIFSPNSHSSYVIYNNPNGTSTYVGSVPITNGFEYSNSSGSMSISNTQYVPLVTNNYSQGYWAGIRGSIIPGNAIVMEYINGNPTYYCRAQIDNGMQYGRLIPGEGCFLFSDSSILYDSYQILVR